MHQCSQATIWPYCTRADTLVVGALTTKTPMTDTPATHIYKYFTTVSKSSKNCQQGDIHYRNISSHCSCKNSMTLSSFFKTSGLSMTFAVFHDFPAWKEVLQNSMTFQDQWAPCCYNEHLHNLTLLMQASRCQLVKGYTHSRASFCLGGVVADVGW